MQLKRIFASIVVLMTALHFDTARAEYPDRPIRLLVPFPAGGAADVLCRIYGQKMKDILGQPVIVENRTGAAGSISTIAVQSSEPDGYTIGEATAATHGLPPPGRTEPFVPKKEYTTIALLARSPMVVIVRNSLNIKTLPELIAYGKKNPGKLTYGSPGVGSGIHLFTMLMGDRLGIELTHVPYRGEAPAITDVISGNLDMLMAPSGYNVVKAGQATAIATTTDKRWFVLPDVPTLTELGYTYESEAWFSIFGPPNLPSDIVMKLNATINKVGEDPEVIAALEPMGLRPHRGPPEDMDKMVAYETNRLMPVFRKAEKEVKR